MRVFAIRMLWGYLPSLIVLYEARSLISLPSRPPCALDEIIFVCLVRRTDKRASENIRKREYMQIQAMFRGRRLYARKKHTGAHILFVDISALARPPDSATPADSANLASAPGRHTYKTGLWYPCSLFTCNT